MYQIRCGICGGDGRDGMYIGETKRPLRLRFNEHVRDMLNGTQDTPMGDHFRERHNGSVIPHGSSEGHEMLKRNDKYHSIADDVPIAKM